MDLFIPFYDYDDNEIVNGATYKYIPCFGEIDPNLIFTLAFTNKMVIVNNKRRKIHCRFEYDGESHSSFEWYDKTIDFEDLQRIN